MPAAGPFRFDNSYARDLDGFSVPWSPVPVAAPRTLFFNTPLARELGLDDEAVAGFEGEAGAAFFAGNRVPEGAEPVAQAYAGHQFGNFSPQLGDGRALLLGEVIDRAGQRRDIALKGSGRTPFSRGGDGRAAVGPMLREALIGEAVHALGIPTTRALAVAATGEPVLRETPLPGAVLTRVAASHIRVGTFQYFAARGESGRVRRLAEYTIARHDPDLAGTPGRFLGLLERVADRQAKLIAQWLNVGFIHGVMNTDNMTVSGETIDYGPCAFVEAYDPAAVFSSIDRRGRYAFGNQPAIAQWNLARLAETLLPLIADDEDQAAAQAIAVIEAFPARHGRYLLDGQRAKLGLRPAGGAAGTGADDAADRALVDDWLALLHDGRVDFTLAWRRLADVAAGDEAPLRALFAAAQVGGPAGRPAGMRTEQGSSAAVPSGAAEPASPSAPGEVLRSAAAPTADASPGLHAWLARWRERLRDDDTAGGASGRVSPAARAERMRRVSPWIIPRNHRVEEALAAASDDDDLGPFDRLLGALRHPFDDTVDHQALAEPAPAELTAVYRTFCGT